MSWQGWLTIVVVLATLGFLLWERYTPDKVLAGAVLVLMGTGVLTPKQALGGFWNSGVLTVAVLFVLVAALKTTGAIRWIGALVMGPPTTEFRAHLRLTGITSALSAFVNNTPVVATLISAVEHWSRASGVPASKLLLPMNYATILGGTCTLIGTSTNLIVAGLVVAQGLPALGMFDPLPAGLAAAGAGLLFMSTIGRRLLPSRRSALDQAAADSREYSVEMLVDPEGRLVGKTADQAGLRHLSGSFLVELSRERELLAAVDPDTVLRAGDRLVFVGVTDAVRELRRIEGLRPATDQVFKIDGPESRRNLVELVLSRFSPAVGKNLRESQFRNHYNAVVIAVSRHGQRLHQKPGDVVMQAGDTLLVETAPDFMAQWGNSPDFLVASLVDGERPVDRRKATIALSVLGAMILSNSLFNTDILWTVTIAALVVIAARCVADMVAGHMSDFSGADPFWTLVSVYVMAVVFTELLTNNAAAILMFPIGLSAATQLGVDPMPFIMAVMIGASAGFITPIGYQTNLMVYGPGGYRFTDYIRVGLPLSIVVGIAVLWTIPRAWPF